MGAQEPTALLLHKGLPEGLALVSEPKGHIIAELVVQQQPERGSHNLGIRVTGHQA